MKEILKGIIELLEEEINYYGSCGGDFNEKCSEHNCSEYCKCHTWIEKEQRIKQLKEQIGLIK